MIVLMVTLMSPSSPVCVCCGLPQPRSSSALAAAPRHSARIRTISFSPIARDATGGEKMLGAIDFRRASKPTVNPRMFSGEVKLRFSTQKGFLDAIDHQFRLFNHQEMASIGHIFDRVVVIPACDEIRPN